MKVISSRYDIVNEFPNHSTPNTNTKPKITIRLATKRRKPIVFRYEPSSSIGRPTYLDSKDIKRLQLKIVPEELAELYSKKRYTR